MHLGIRHDPRCYAINYRSVHRNGRDFGSRGSLNFSPMNLGTWDGACDISVTSATGLVRDNTTIEIE